MRFHNELCQGHEHARNVVKSRKQGNMYFGFDTGTGVFKESKKAREISYQRLLISEWFRDRHKDQRGLGYIRECIGLAISDLRELIAPWRRSPEKLLIPVRWLYGYRYTT